jgi:hypothetical protein
MRRTVLASAATAAALALTASPAVAALSIGVSPATVDRDATQTVTGRGWPVIEFCERHVSVRVQSAQNRVRLGSARVRASGRFRFRWTPDEANVGPGRWKLVVRMRCESGKDGSPVIRRRAAAIRVRA